MCLEQPDTDPLLRWAPNMNVMVLRDPSRDKLMLVTSLWGEGVGRIQGKTYTASRSSDQTVLSLIRMFSLTQSGQSSGLSHRFQRLVGDKLGEQRREK